LAQLAVARPSSRVRSGGSALATLRAGGDSAAGMRNSLPGTTAARLNTNSTRPSTSRVFLDRQTGPHHGTSINVRIRPDLDLPHHRPVVVKPPKVVIHKDITIIHPKTNIIHPVPVCPAPVIYDDYYYDDYSYSDDDYYYDDGYYDDGYYADGVLGYTDYDNGYEGGGGYYEADWDVDPYYDAAEVYTTVPRYNTGVVYATDPWYSEPVYVDTAPSWYAYSDQYYGWPRLYRRLWFGLVSPYRHYRLSYYWNRFTDYCWESLWPTYWRSHLALGFQF